MFKIQRTIFNPSLSNFSFFASARKLSIAYSSLILKSSTASVAVSKTSQNYWKRFWKINFYFTYICSHVSCLPVPWKKHCLRKWSCKTRKFFVYRVFKICFRLIINAIFWLTNLLKVIERNSCYLLSGFFEECVNFFRRHEKSCYVFFLVF